MVAETFQEGVTIHHLNSRCFVISQLYDFRKSVFGDYGTTVTFSPENWNLFWCTAHMINSVENSFLICKSMRRYYRINKILLLACQ